MRRLFIVNPFSARVSNKGATLRDLAKEMKVELFSLDPFDALPGVVTQAAENGVTHVVIEGGDGTVQGVVSEFLRQAAAFKTFPAFSIAPGGMTNQVAKNIGLKSASLNAVRRDLNRDLTPVQTPLIEVEDRDGNIHSGFLLSTGAIPQITRYTTGELHKKGIGGSFAVLGGILKGIRGDDEDLMQVTPINADPVYKGPHLGTVITTLPSLMLGLDPFWGNGDGPLRLTWVEGNYRHLGRHILSLWLGRKTVDRTADGFHSSRVATLSIEYQGDVVLDGEFLSIPSGKFTVRTTRPVTFLR